MPSTAELLEKSGALPPTPNGYQPPVQFRYPKGKLFLLTLLLVGGLTPLFFALQGGLQQLVGRHPAAIWSETLHPLLLIGTAAGIIIIHEWVHGLVFQRLGYQVQYGFSWKMFAAYAAAFGQMQKRGDNMKVAVAPMLLITVVGIPFLALPSPQLAQAALAAILFNLFGIAGDIYLIWRLYQLPAQTLIYDVNLDLMLIYLPQNSKSSN